MQEGNTFLITEIDESMESDILVPLTKEIKKQRLLRDGMIDLYINSNGGFVYITQHIIELMEMAKRLDITVRTMVMSMAYSGGSMLAIAGTPGERYIARDAEHLIHYGMNGGVNTTPLNLARQHESNNRSFKWNVNHYKKYANVPDLEMHMADDNFYITSSNSIKWGLADRYMDKFDIGYNGE